MGAIRPSERLLPIEHRLTGFEHTLIVLFERRRDIGKLRHIIDGFPQAGTRIDMQPFRVGSIGQDIAARPILAKDRIRNCIDQGVQEAELIGKLSPIRSRSIACF